MDYNYMVIGDNDNDNQLNSEVIDYCKNLSEAKSIKEVNEQLSSWKFIRVYEIKEIR